MKTGLSSTSFCPPVVPLNAGHFQNRTLRHTRRVQGTRDWLLIYTVGGSGLYRFPAGEFHSRPHDITLFRPGSFQDYQRSPRTQKWDLFYIHFLPRPEWLDGLRWPELAPGLMHLHVRESALRLRLRNRFRDLIHFQYGSQPRKSLFGLNVLEEILLWCDSINPLQTASQVDPRVRNAMDLLSREYAAPFSEQKLARAAGLSPSRLRLLFRASTRTSPRQFQEQRRLQRAQHLLALSRQTIGEIALEMGYENPFYFSLRFKNFTGECPRAFRQRVTGK
jgi:AraC family transcriptional regulator of arabinose operon